MPGAKAEVDRDADLGAGHVGDDGRLVVAGHDGAVAGDDGAADGDRQAVALGGLPALPTAMTMRPQFASPPAMAVLTSGELATAMATRPAEASLTAPATSMRMRCFAPSPSRTTISASSSSNSAMGRGKGGGVGGRVVAGGAGGDSSTVSEVEVSLSTVVRLKLAFVPATSSGCRVAAGRAASVKTKQSMVAMSGAIMPEPLAMPSMVTVRPPRLAGGGRFWRRCRWS